mmetsp:Transcript_12445/g.13636  ORF Transcript_12445/g.13636 Transcript_12445/m.13636 type:complete len:318 (+) Transcript_12445:656-1609(+)
MSEENTGVSINIRPRVSNLSGGVKDLGDNLVGKFDQLDIGVILAPLLSELSLGSVSRISLSQDSMTVSGNNSTGLKNVPQGFFQIFFVDVITQLFSKIYEELENFLVSQSMERSSQTIETSRERKVRITEGGSNKMNGMSTDVSSFVVTVDNLVQSHQFIELRFIMSQHVRVVGSPIQVLVEVRGLSVLVQVSVDESSNSGDIGDQIKSIFEDILPVFTLVNTSGVGLGEVTLFLESQNTHRELSHGVKILGETVDQFLNMFGEVVTILQFFLQMLALILGRDIRSNQQPQKSFGQGFSTFNSLGQFLSQTVDVISS